QRGEHRGGGEHPSQYAGALIVTGRAPHEDPCLIETAQDRERSEQEHEQPDEGDQDAEADAARQIVHLRADPQAGEWDRAPAEQAEDDHRGEQGAGYGAVEALAQIAATLGQLAEAGRRRPGPASDEQPASIGWIAAHLSPMFAPWAGLPVSRHTARRTARRIAR